jgi:hypothetical protein
MEGAKGWQAFFPLFSKFFELAKTADCADIADVFLPRIKRMIRMARVCHVERSRDISNFRSCRVIIIALNGKRGLGQQEREGRSNPDVHA